MSTQYDSISESYHQLKRLPHPRLEVHNLYINIEPHIRGAKVLDLACGSGFHAKNCIKWGAESVTGVDVSTKMIEIANSVLTPDERDRVIFETADCSKPTDYPGGPFDVVIGAWFLNYASEAVEMVQMFKNISQNLKDGGMFIGICPHPTNDPGSFVRYLEEYHDGRYNGHVYVKEDVPDGVLVRLRLVAEENVTPVEFDAYHLRQEVYEQSARKGGMGGELKWCEIETPIMSDLGEHYWDEYHNGPWCGIIKIYK